MCSECQCWGVGAETGGMLGLAGHQPGVSETPSQRKREKSDRAGHLMSLSSLLEGASTVTCKVHAHPHTYAYMHMHIHTQMHARTCACTMITHRETRFFLTYSYWLWNRYHDHVPAFSTGITLLSPKKNCHWHSYMSATVLFFFQFVTD